MSEASEGLTPACISQRLLAEFDREEREPQGKLSINKPPGGV